MASPQRIKTIAEFHALRGLNSPKHPLISVIELGKQFHRLAPGTHSMIFDFYMISIKRGMNHKYQYGQQEYQYDFNNGVMFFTAPGQILTIQIDQNNEGPEGWLLLVHPDFLWNTILATAIKQYDFFHYSANEALFLSEDEESRIQQLMNNVREEYLTSIDSFSQSIIISQLETILNYSNRFYGRQFITREKVNRELLVRIENLLESYVQSKNLASNGLPAVQQLSADLGISPSYLRRLLKTLTGQSPQQLIHEKLIEKAKEELTTTELSVSEIAYKLGFEQPQSFSRLFKIKTNISPLEFRKSFN
ncbi:helix-turn-helix domain-containing protein [Marinoscillum pacificum]|uniref:helix-turn-helix domain-containing protein n=1 Tax=Marinoscillum pacificum TaxID=392723 RepID=UPI0021577905|nr:AraC family transcriptional regulator [Marinoscillum pacificum]